MVHDVLSTRNSQNRFSALGKLYYFRGKIILAILEDSTSISFPTTLSPEKPDGNFPEYLQRNLNATSTRVYRSVGDILQEGEATLKQALSYAESTGDEIRLGKAMNLLGQLFSHYCFSRIAYVPFTSLFIIFQLLQLQLCRYKPYAVLRPFCSGQERKRGRKSQKGPTREETKKAATKRRRTAEGEAKTETDTWMYVPSFSLSNETQRVLDQREKRRQTLCLKQRTSLLYLQVGYSN